MVTDGAKLAVQSSSTAYNFGKDIVQYMMDKAKYIRDLEDNLTDLIAEIITIYSRREQIERILKKDISKEKSTEYMIIRTHIEGFPDKYNKFINKYGKYCQNLPNYVLAELDVSTSSALIETLEKRKPTILTRHFFKLAKLSKNIKKLRERISKMVDGMKQENMLFDKEPEQVQVKDVEFDIPSFDKYVNEVVGYLHQDGIRSIGIVGPIGVGKTTVMEKLNNQLKDTITSSKHDIVIWIDYPKQQDADDKIVEMMQDVIIGRMKLIMGNADRKADIISTALCDRKYILLIDQLSSAIDLNRVGIRKDHKLGKVVFASSSNKYITHMTDKYVQIRPLSKKDAFDFFEEVCGKIHDQRIHNLADRIIELCGGLPLVIKLVATYLIGKDEEEVWSDVKRMLQSETKETKLLSLGGVGKAYKLVYDGLEESYMKKCLLFGTLFPNDYKIYEDYLVECWMAEGFLELSNADTRQLRRVRRARDHGATVLSELIDRHLLERCWDKYVKMPVYFRKVALLQQYPDNENCVILVPEKSGENELLDATSWERTTRMSLIGRNPKLPQIPESNNMSTLLLQLNQELAIEDSFFKNMGNLRVLDLFKTGINSLPSSISTLANLVSLYLNDCSSLAELLPLEVKMPDNIELLDIRGTLLGRLPNQIGTMCKLRCLRVSLGQKGCNRNIREEVAIPPGTISCLKELEELVIEMGCCNQGWNKIADQIASELASLEKLTTLFINFPSIRSLQIFVTNSISWKNTRTNWENNTFRSFKFFIGCCERRHPYGPDVSGILASRQLGFSTDEEIPPVNDGGIDDISPVNDQVSSVDQVLKQASAFELVGNSLVESLSEFDLTNAGSLKVCIVERCKNLRWIVDGTKMSTTGRAIFQCLEMLHLFDLNSLNSIWNASVLPESLTRLKVLTLSGCPALTHILTLELAKLLSSLQHIKVEHCSEIGDIIKIDTYNMNEHADLADTLPKLETFELVNLPKLQSICASTSKKWRSLRKIVVTRCRELKKLHLSNMDKLERIQSEYSWWTALQESKEVKQHFLQYCDFIITELALSGGDNHEGESSSNGDSVYLLQALDNIDSQIGL